MQNNLVSVGVGDATDDAEEEQCRKVTAGLAGTTATVSAPNHGKAGWLSMR